MKSSIKLFLFSVLFLAYGMLSAAALDSIGIKKENAETYVVHKVDKGETLYSLSRRYMSTVESIKKANDEELAEGLKIGQILNIPYGSKFPKKSTHVVALGETLFAISRKYNVSIADLKKWNDLETNEVSVDQELYVLDPASAEGENLGEVKSSNTAKTHTVEKGETLFSISRKYGIPVADLKKWNEMGSAEISVGQVLLLEKAKKAPIIDTDNDAAPITQEEFLDSLNKQQYDKVIESGIAEVIPDTEDTEKYVALHKTAPKKTIIFVRNQVTGKTAFVRVIGSLPDTPQNEKIVMKVSHKVYRMLGGVDQKFPVEISYMP